MRLWITGLLLILNITLLSAQEKSLVLLHVNDTHSRMEPLNDDSEFHNTGGCVRMDAYINEVRTEEKNVLLFHSGDIVQGTPYYNLFRGQAEIAALNKMGVNACCIGNHEFDYGLEGLKTMIEAANFPFVSCNYDFSETILRDLVKEYAIFKIDGMKIGVLGLGPNPDGLIFDIHIQGMKFKDPIISANQTAKYLKEKEKCDLIICLSHLGYYEEEEDLGDITLAKNSHFIDLILGGHTHTFLENPENILNLEGKKVVISQMGYRGIYVGRMDVKMKK